MGARQDGNELPDSDGDDDDGDGHLCEKGGKDQPEEFVEEFQLRTPLGWFIANHRLIVSTFGVRDDSMDHFG